MTMKKRKSNVRNPFYNHPLLKKSGVHEKSDKAKRRVDKQKLKNEWCSLILLIEVIFNNTIQLHW